MPIKVLVNGGFGRMGQMAVKTISENTDFELVGQTGREYDLGASIRDSGAQVVIDFTHPDAVFNNTQTIIAAGAHPVIGTTGLTSSQIEALQKECESKKLGGLIAPNFSIGAILMMRLAKDIVQHMPHVEIIEYHHNNKVESPSGTAIKSAEILAKARQEKPETHLSKEVIPGARGANHLGIPIHAIRLPGLLAHQQIMFGSEGETLTLKHDSIDRQCFMPGMLLACKRVMEINYLAYGLDEVL